MKLVIDDCKSIYKVYCLLSVNKNVEKLGNIHNNPELMEVK